LIVKIKMIIDHWSGIWCPVCIGNIVKYLVEFLMTMKKVTKNVNSASSLFSA